MDVAKDVSTAMEKIILKEPRGSSAQVQLFGGQVTSWKNERGEELLFLSSKAVFKPPKAIRGGIPICFPQFGGFGALEQHGFARNRVWKEDLNPPGSTAAGSSSSSTGSVGITASGTTTRTSVDLILTPSADDMKIWPHSFELRLRVGLGLAGELTLTTRVKNTDSKPFSFTFALHTYLSVSDISEVRVEGLETLDYLDSLQDKQRRTEQGDALSFDAEVDRIYLGTPSKVVVIDHDKKRTLVVRKEGLPDAVVWNPWEKKAKAMADFGDEEYKHMICLEAAAIEKPVNLKPGEEWTGRQELSTVSSSYFSGMLDPDRVRQGA